MANKDTPFGLRPVMHRNGAPYNGAANPYFVPSSDGDNMFIGDPVVLTGSGNAAGVSMKDGDFGEAYRQAMLPAVELATAGSGNDVTGVIVAVDASPSDGLEKTWREGGRAAVVWVADDPELLFEVQEDSDGGALDHDDIGNNAELEAGTGSQITGLSGWEIDSSTAGTGSGLQVRLHRLVNRPDNEQGDHAKWLVSINAHTLTNTTGV